MKCSEVLGRTCGTYFPSNRLMHTVSTRDHNLTIALLHDPVMCIISTNILRHGQNYIHRQPYHAVLQCRRHAWNFSHVAFNILQLWSCFNFLRLNSFAHQMAAAHKFRAAMILSLHSENKPCSFSKTCHYIIYY
jgi:hypothetical protein